MRLTAATFDFGIKNGKVIFNLSGTRKAIVKRNGVEITLAGFDVSRPSVPRAARALYDAHGQLIASSALTWAQFRFTPPNTANQRVVNYDFEKRAAEIYSEFDSIDSPFVVPFGPHEPQVSYRTALSLLHKRLKDELS